VSKKREQLIRSGEALFVKHGMQRVTVGEICEHANVSRPTFYKYFDNKEALARKVVDAWVTEALESIRAIQEAEISFPEKMKRVLKVKQELSGRPGDDFLEDLIPLKIDLSNAFREVMRYFVEAQRNGDIRGDMRPEFLLAGFDMLNRLQHDPRFRTSYENPEELAGDVFKLFYFGALSSQHREAGLTETDG
jgi:AcrR family transcriptional regulator